jgi:autotransporter-associated beta strand protein
MGYLPLDYDEVAVIQTIRSDVIINLTADSYLGQIYPAGVSNGANSIFYDMGKLNTTTNLDPGNVGLRGSYLVIDGDITGSFNLTKVGQDVIKLAGVNSFLNLNIEGGIIQVGSPDAVAPTSVVSTRGEGTSGIFDLNGYNLTIGGLSGSSGAVDNSAFDDYTLFVNTAADYVYGGSIGGAVTLRKQGSAKQTLTGFNDYVGGTVLEEGVLSVAADTSLGRVHLTTRVDSLRFLGGTLETTADMTIAPTRGLTLDASVGGVDRRGARHHLADRFDHYRRRCADQAGFGRSPGEQFRKRLLRRHEYRQRRAPRRRNEHICSAVPSRRDGRRRLRRSKPQRLRSDHRFAKQRRHGPG